MYPVLPQCVLGGVVGGAGRGPAEGRGRGGGRPGHVGRVAATRGRQTNGAAQSRPPPSRHHRPIDLERVVLESRSGQSRARACRSELNEPRKVPFQCHLSHLLVLVVVLSCSPLYTMTPNARFLRSSLLTKGVTTRHILRVASNPFYNIRDIHYHALYLFSSTLLFFSHNKSMCAYYVSLTTARVGIMTCTRVGYPGLRARRFLCNLHAGVCFLPLIGPLRVVSALVQALLPALAVGGSGDLTSHDLWTL